MAGTLMPEGIGAFAGFPGGGECRRGSRGPDRTGQILPGRKGPEGVGSRELFERWLDQEL